MFENIKKVHVIGFSVFVILVVILLFTKSKFNNVLVSDNINNLQPNSFTPLGSDRDSQLVPPVVKEEIGLSMLYPQGSGVGMSPKDSNAFTSSNPYTLLTDHTIPESYGESSLTDPDGTKGAQEGARVIKLNNPGNQTAFKPLDESQNQLYSTAYSTGEVQNGSTLLSGEYINYSDSFIPEDSLSIQTSPGQKSTLDNCEQTYPKVGKYSDFCITDGDIPYGQVVNGKVNPRLVSRWQSYTGNYSPEEALNGTDGLLYPSV